MNSIDKAVKACAKALLIQMPQCSDLVTVSYDFCINLELNILAVEEQFQITCDDAFMEQVLKALVKDPAFGEWEVERQESTFIFNTLPDYD